MNALKQRTCSSLRAPPNIMFTLPLCRVDRQVELIWFDIIVAPPPVESFRPNLPWIQPHANAMNKFTPGWRRRDDEWRAAETKQRCVRAFRQIPIQGVLSFNLLGQQRLRRLANKCLCLRDERRRQKATCSDQKSPA